MFELDFSSLCRVLLPIYRYTNYKGYQNNWPTPGGNHFFISYCNDDLFLSESYHGTAYISPPLRMKDVLGLPSSLVDQDRSVSYHTFRPTSIPWDGKEDQQTYGSLLSSFERLMTHGSSVDVKSVIRKEKGVQHLAYNGKLSVDSLIPMYRISSSVGGDYFDSSLYTTGEGYSYLGNHHTSGVRVSTTSDGGEEGALGFSYDSINYDETGFEYIPPGWNFDAVDRIRSIVSAITNLHGGIWSTPFEVGWRRTYIINYDNSRQLKDGSYMVDILYTYTLENQIAYSASWLVNLKYNVKIKHQDTPSSPFVNNATRIIDRRIFELHDFSHVTPLFGYSPSPTVYTVEPVVLDDWGISFSSATPGFFAIPPSTSFNVLSCFGSFKNSVPTNSGFLDLNREAFLRKRFESDLQHIRPSSFLAASDALSKATTILDSNWLQNLQHLKDVLGLLPDLSGLVKILAKASDGDLSVIPDIVDYLSQVILKWNFQQKPIIRDGKQVLATDLLKAVQILSQPKFLTCYGKYRYEFSRSESYMRGTQVLETRAKLRLSVDLSSLLTSVLVADSLGFLPTLSRLWSLVPFSFVVDWFTNMSERLKLVDNQIKFMGFNTHYCVYSYKIFHFPDIDDLDRNHLIDFYQDSLRSALLNEAPLQELPFSLSVYRREISFHVPRLTDSRYDFLKRTNPPNNWTVGALLWQLI